MNWETTLKNKKPDFLDFDGDGDTDEPMVDAIKDKELANKMLKERKPHSDDVELYYTIKDIMRRAAKNALAMENALDEIEEAIRNR